MGNLVKLGMAWGILLLAHTIAGAEPPARPDYLILKSGAVLSGRIVQDGTSYVVKSLTSTGESRYPASIVAKVCTSPQEVYDVLKKCIVTDDAGDHCRLAKFCLQHDLMKEARSEIDEALRCDSRSADAKVLIKQWLAKDAKPTEQPVDVPALPAASIKPIPPASLDDWPAALNPTVFQDFSRRIQPIVLTGCGTGACHGVLEGKRAFVLKRGLVGVQPSMEMSRANLERLLALVEANTPETSELLRKSQQPHGNLKHWSVTSEQQAALKYWVHYMAGKPIDVAKKDAAKATNDFASGSAPNNTNSSAEASSKLPTIPGMSGSAIQQTGGEIPLPAKPIEQPTPQGLPPAQSGGLPPIPGVSGKAQGGTGKQSIPLPPGKNPVPTPDGASKPQALQDTPAYREYARRLGMMQSLASPKDGVPDRMQIVNAGTYHFSVPPPPEFSEEIQSQLKRQEEAKKAPADTSSKSTSFLQSGTIINGPK